MGKITVFIRSFIFFICVVNALVAHVKASELNIAFLSVGPEQTARLSYWLNRFETQNPHININLQTYDDATYKKHLRTWLESDKFDIVYWQAGRKLSQLIDLGLLTPASSIVDERALKELMPESVLSQVTADGFIYGFPLAQYTWGFYYNKGIFAQNDIPAPATWTDFIQALDKLKLNKTTPLVQANKEGWEPLIWLDMLSLNVGGKTLRKKLIEDQSLPLYDQKQITEKLKAITGNDTLLNPKKSWSWQEAINAVIDERAAMTFLGSFAEPLIEQSNNNNIGFFPFPDSIGRSLVAPMDLFVIPTASTRKNNAATFLSFLMQPEILSQLAFDLGWLPVTQALSPDIKFNERQQLSLEYLLKTPVHTQYFDREANVAYAIDLGDKLADAMVTKMPEQVFEKTRSPILPAFISPTAQNKSKTLQISAIKGHKATFLASQLISKIYKGIGYDIEITRFDSSEAAIKSHQKGMDADLLRVQYFETKNPLLLRVPEPVISAWIYMVINKTYCSGENIDYSALSNVAVGSDAIAFQEWAEQTNTKLTVYKDSHKMWRDFKNNEITALLAFEPDLIENETIVKHHCRSRVSKTDFFHYVNKRNSDLVPLLDKEIKELKKRDEYNAIIKRFGIK